jgi:hypothetical protein
MAVPIFIKKMLDEAKTRSLREDLKKGDYAFVLRGLTYERREKREKLGKVLWIDYTVEESEALDPTVKPNEPGTELDNIISLEGQYADMSAKDLKTFLVCLTGCDAKDASEQFDKLVDCVSDEGVHTRPEQPARGMVIHAATYDRETKSGKNKGKIKTYPSWRGDLASENTPENIAARRKKLDEAAKK